MLGPDGAALLQNQYVFTSPKGLTFTTAAAGVHTLVLDPQGAAVGRCTVAVT